MCCFFRSYKIISVLCSLLVLFGCDKRELNSDNIKEQIEDRSDIITENRIKVKFSPDFGENFTEIKNSVATKSSENSAVSNILMQMGASNMRRLFAYNEEYDNLMRKHGLHLWYVVEFDGDAAVTKSVSDIKSIKGIDIVENIVRPVCSVKPSSASFFSNNRPVTMSNYVMTGPNDPRYKEQWNFKNRGQSSVPGSAEGADINIEEAWKIETGDPRVIVAVIDGGIDIQHEDLKDNLYTVNTNYEDEYNDLGKHGYNFCKKIIRIYQEYDNVLGKIVDKAERDPKQDAVELTAHFHGTHVAGIVAAKNNNRIGVCGVAGGNGESNSGARLLSCQIMDNWGGSDYYENAFVYAQRRGAVIAQCSWGWPMESGYNWGMFTTKYGDKSMSLKDAIDYFIEFAGCDSKGNQRKESLMKGGLVVFAAGNEPYEFQSFPACYDKVIAVTAMSPNFKRSSFTTYGNWADIMAPGGNGADGVSDPGNILSTYPTSEAGGGYAFLPGTSMACPHVAGVAALIVSKFGDTNYTADSLKKQLLSALRPYDLYKYNNEPKYKGKLGKGYIDAYRALKINEYKHPDKVANMKIDPLFKEINFSWSAVNDPDDGTADFYDLYYSTTQLTESNYLNAGKMETFFSEMVKKGETFKCTLEGLELDTQYYFAVVARDRWGLKSGVTFGSAKTKQNHAPVLKLENEEPIKLTSGEKAKNSIIVTEPDGHGWTYTIEKPRFVSESLSSDKSRINLVFTSNGDYGKYSVKVTAKDIYGFETTLTFGFEIYENNAPKLVKSIDQIFISEKNTMGYTLDLADYIRDNDGHKVKYSYECKDYNVCFPVLSESRMFITPVSKGKSSITIIAEDEHGAKMKKNIQVQVVGDELVYIAYPVPVSKVLNVRLNDRLDNAVVKIRNVNGSVFLTREVVVSQPSDRLVELDLSKYAPGTYVLYVESAGEKYSQTFIKR